MKLFRRFIFFLVSMIGTYGLTAQDFHKSLYNMMPLAVNPAYTGDFEGTFRLSGMYKDQTNSTYKTPSFSVDVPILMVRKRDWLSAGISFDSDTAGELKFGTTRSLLSVSYHLSLDKKGKDYFILGYQFGSDNTKIRDQNAAISLDGNDNIINNLNPDNATSNNINNIGVMYRSQLDKNTMLNIGAAYLYIIRQEKEVASSASGNVGKRPSEFVVHGLIDRNIDKNLSIHPSFIIRSRGTEGTEVMVQAMAGYLIRPDLALRLKGGLGYDLDQGPALLLGADYGDWRFGLSFEFPIYGIAEATNFGGFEISASKIINVYKKPAVEPTICCPDL